MSAITFDTLRFSERLQAGGFTAEQAKTASAAFSDSLSEWSSNQQPGATKTDVDSVRLALREESANTRTDIEALRIQTKASLKEMEISLTTLEMKLQNRIDEMELRISAGQKELLLRIGGMLVALGGVLIGIKYLG